MTARQKNKRRQKFLDDQYLKQLGQQLREQDTDHQLSPRYWVIAENKLVETIEEYSTSSEYTIDDLVIENLEQLQTILVNSYGVSPFDELIEIIRNAIDLDDLLQDSMTLESQDGEQFPIAITHYHHKDHVVSPESGVYILKSDAQRRIKNEPYPFKDEPHTYAKTAYRSPAYDRLLKVLMRK